MTRTVTVTELTENEAAELARRPDARPCVDDRLAGEVRTKIGELRGGAAPDIALAVVGEAEWLAYAMDDGPAADSGIFRVTPDQASEVGPLYP